MTRTSSPILWYGDLVDFGTYSTAVSNKVGDQEISFSFVFDRIQVGSDFYLTEEGHFQSEGKEHLNVEFDVVIGPIEIEHTVSRPPEAERTAVRKVILKSGHPAVAFELLIDHQQRIVALKVDDFDVVQNFPQIEMQITSGTILPEVLFVTKERESRTVVRRRRGDTELARVLQDLLRPVFSKSMKDSVLANIAQALLSKRPLTKDEIREALPTIRNTRWASFIERATSEENLEISYIKIRSLIATAVLSDLLKQVDQQLRGILSGVLYIGPARARSERYYRYQDLSVSEIDPDGKNFPMFLNSLSFFQVKRLSDWIESLFGYGISIGREGGHISINLTAKGNISNIVDTGYGVSQILPVLGQIWWARSRPPLPASRQAQVSLLAIEQPELHLHPAHQALLADALVGEVGLSSETRRPTEAQIHFVVETHSETLVNRLGELVEAGRLKHSDVQIVLFEPDISGEHVTSIRTSSFNEAGELVDWPYGFFQPSIV